jgi:hypothetical protein
MKIMVTILLKNFKKSFVGAFILVLSATSLFATNPSNVSDDSDQRMKISLMLNSAGTYERELFVMADESATSGYDSGFDTAIDAVQDEDMYWLINSGKFIEQGINEINEETIIKIGMHTYANGINTISIHKLENIPSTMKIFMHDKTLGEYHSIKDGAYEVYLDAGVYLNRFEIVFAQPETLGVSQIETRENQLDIRFYYATNKIEIVNNANINIESVNVYSLLGQPVYTSNISNSNNKININTNAMSTGTYIVIVSTEYGINSKKILVN